MSVWPRQAEAASADVDVDPKVLVERIMAELGKRGMF
jgi:hypothetical protein